jgi:hypothetical protein
MSYATRACSQLTAASNFRRLAGRGSLNRSIWYAASVIRAPRAQGLPSPRFNSRYFTTSPRHAKDLIQTETARETDKRDQDAHQAEVAAGLEEATKQQIKRPWQREGADKPPVDESRRNMNKNMTKGT